jgi:hypothetical protein
MLHKNSVRASKKALRVCPSPLTTETVRFSETSLSIYESTRHHNPQEQHRHSNGPAFHEEQSLTAKSHFTEY